MSDRAGEVVRADDEAVYTLHGGDPFKVVHGIDVLYLNDPEHIAEAAVNILGLGYSAVIAGAEGTVAPYSVGRISAGGSGVFRLLRTSYIRKDYCVGAHIDYRLCLNRVVPRYPDEAVCSAGSYGDKVLKHLCLSDGGMLHVYPHGVKAAH